jgi:hypothetical protein
LGVSWLAALHSAAQSIGSTLAVFQTVSDDIKVVLCLSQRGLVFAHTRLPLHQVNPGLLDSGSHHQLPPQSGHGSK